MRKIIYTRPDGGLSIVSPVINSYPVREEITESEAEQRAWNKLPPTAINPQWVEASAIPTDRTFRNGWKAGTNKVEHDLVKCRDIARQKLREKRAPLLATLDVEYMKADEIGNITEKARIVSEKNKLRDITKNPAIEQATTPEALKVIIASL